MSLIACPECGQQVSSLAASCPRCAAPIAQKEAAQAVGQQVTTTEATSKKIKAQKAWAIAFVIAGVFVAMAAPGEGTSTAAGLMMVGGVIWYIVVAIRGWWHHG